MLSASLLLLHAVPPWTGAGHQTVVTFDHLHRLAQAVLGGLHAHLARLDPLLLAQPGAIVPPDAWAMRPLERRPGRIVDHLPAPAIFGHEAGRVPRIERGHVVARVAAERDRHLPFIALRDVVALPDIVEAEELHHQVMW